jgi:hypothetical protein
MNACFPGEADRDASRELWVDTVRCGIEHGRPVRTVRAKTAKERDMAKKQSYWLSRKSFGVGGHPNYDRINWAG